MRGSIFAENGVPLTRAENDRVAGWYDLHEWLRPWRDEQERMRAALTVFRSCENLIRTLPSLARDPKDPNDAAVTPHELTHAPDALRYFAAGRPVPAREELRDPRLSGRFGRRPRAAVL